MDLATKNLLVNDENFWKRIQMAIFEEAGQILAKRRDEDKAAIQWATRVLNDSSQVSKRLVVIRILSSPDLDDSDKDVPDSLIRSTVSKLVPLLIQSEV